MNRPLPGIAAFHGGRLSIDLAALVENWRLLAARAAPAKTAAAVKADAYGLGIEAVVKALGKAGCEIFFVAHLSEATRVRRVLPSAILYVLNGLPLQSAPAYRAIDARPVLGSREEVCEWLRQGNGAPAALHVDTGMNRLGLPPSEVGNLPERFVPCLLMSHFVSSEMPDDPINERQIAAFRAVHEQNPEWPASLCNSSGLFLKVENQIHFDVVRPGYALYGGNPRPGVPNPMREVVRLEARVAQLRTVPAGDSVGYNSQWRAQRDSRIATLSIGYADGYLRSGGGVGAEAGGEALVHGVRCPIAGRISMDLITVDVTDAPPVQRGDWVTLLGGGLDLDEVAGRLKTNGYELLTSLGRRHERLYVGG